MKFQFQLNFYLQSTLNSYDVIRPRLLTAFNVMRQCREVVWYGRRRRVFWRWVLFVCGLCRPVESVWIDSSGKNGKWTSRRGPIWSWVSATCNRCGVNGGLKSQELIESDHFWRFLGKTSHDGKILKMLFRKDSSRHRSTCCMQILWNLADQKSIKSCVTYLTKQNKISPGSPAVATHRVKWRHISVVAMRSPFCRSTRRTVCS